MADIAFTFRPVSYAGLWPASASASPLSDFDNALLELFPPPPSKTTKPSKKDKVKSEITLPGSLWPSSPPKDDCMQQLYDYPSTSSSSRRSSKAWSKEASRNSSRHPSRRRTVHFSEKVQYMDKSHFGDKVRRSLDVHDLIERLKTHTRHHSQ